MVQASGGVAHEVSQGRHRLILRQPEKGNALSSQMVRQLSAAYDDAIGSGARLVVFEGEGKHFCTGFDLSNLEEESDASLLLRFVEIEQLLQKVHASPVMTVAIAKGRCFGAGADLFASCDRRIAIEGASFAFPGSAFGLVLGTARLAGRIGRDNARRCLLEGSTLSDTMAREQCLVTDLIAETELSSMVDALAAAAQRLEASTVAALHAVTDNAGYDRDLAELVRSASRPGIRDRIQNYKAARKGG